MRSSAPRWQATLVPPLPNPGSFWPLSVHDVVSSAGAAVPVVHTP